MTCLCRRVALYLCMLLVLGGRLDSSRTLSSTITRCVCACVCACMCMCMHACVSMRICYITSEVVTFLL